MWTVTLLFFFSVFSVFVFFLHYAGSENAYFSGRMGIVLKMCILVLGWLLFWRGVSKSAGFGKRRFWWSNGYCFENLHFGGKLLGLFQSKIACVRR